MRIDRLELQNFRCFEQFALDFHPTLNVLIGQNGAGKSAVLTALSIGLGYWTNAVGAKSGQKSGLQEQDVRTVGRMLNDDYIFDRQPSAMIRLHQHVMDKSFTISQRRPVTSERTEADYEDSLLYLGRRIQTVIRSATDEGDSTILPVVACYGTNRLWIPANPDSGLRGPMKKEGLSRFVGYDGALGRYRDPNALLRWMERQARIAFQEEKEPLLYRAVCEAMRQMTEGAIDVRYDNRTLEVAIRFTNGDLHTFPQLSDGQRNMLALAGDIAMRMARLNPQLGESVLAQTPGVVLIDELDLHLHPEWQRHVVADLQRTFPKVQFVVTTHSPLILSEVQPECIILLEKEEERLVAQKPDQSYGFDVDSILQFVMHTPSRPQPAQAAIDAADDALEEGQIGHAREQVATLRKLLHGEHAEVARLEASINNLEALVDAVD